MIIIGSRALAYWNPDFIVNTNADWDVVGDAKEVASFMPISLDGNGQTIEWHDPKILNNNKIQELFGSGHYYQGAEICSIAGLVLLKRSHLWRERKFDSNIAMYHRYLYPMMEGRTVTVEQMQWFSERVEMTKKEFPQGKPSLNMSNEDFFDDLVTKKYDHDDLHELYAYGLQPMYKLLKHKGKEGSAWCEKSLWEELEDWQKNITVAEEAYVIATERYLVPNDWRYASRRAYFNAVGRICTTLTSGWFRDWAIDHYPDIIALYNEAKFQEVKGKLNELA